MNMTLRAFISDSGLPQEDKDLWFSILLKIDEFQVKIFEDFISGNEKNLKFLTENLKAKEIAFRNNDQEALDRILKEESIIISTP